MMVSVPEETPKKRILVIEDEPDIVRGLRDALEFEGFEVLARGTGAEGLAAAMDWAPDAVLLDLMLPDDNGYRVCETCLLYTSDAADERSSVDLGGRRIIK